MSSPDRPAGHPTPLPLVLVVENVRSVHNLGAIFRTADAVGVERILLSPLCAAPPRPEIHKTALGAERSVPWSQTDSLSEALRALRAEGYQIVALEQTGRSQDLFSTATSWPVALVVGHEREGVSAETQALCDLHLEIPMRGTSAHSLNVATATGVALYELSRRLCYDGDNIAKTHHEDNVLRS